MQYSPHWDLSTIPDDKLKSERARRNSAKRVKPTGGKREGAGRKPAQSCLCGTMTVTRAAQRNHKCA